MDGKLHVNTRLYPIPTFLLFTEEEIVKIGFKRWAAGMKAARYYDVDVK